jgi:putative membrane protein
MTFTGAVFLSYRFLVLTGVVGGMANIIPGVSGGTIAVVLGIFDELIGCVNHFTKDIKKNLLFLLPLLAGMAVGIVGLGSIIEYCMANFSFQTAVFFVGLVVGSIPLIYKKANEKKDIKPSYYAATVLAVLLVIALALIKPDESAGADVAVTPIFMVILFFGGLIAAAAMVVPGISGSFMMILMGLYPTVLRTISMIRDWLTHITDFSLLLEIIKIAAPLGLGILAGIILISKLIAFLLNKFHTVTYLAILGLMLGTVYAIFVDPATYQSDALLTLPILAVAVVTFAAGSVIAFFLGKE